MQNTISRHLIPLTLLLTAAPAWATYDDGVVYSGEGSQISSTLWIQESSGGQVQRVFWVDDNSGVVRMAARTAGSSSNWSAWSTGSVTTSGGAGEVTSAVAKNGMAFVSYRAANRAHYLGWRPLCFFGPCPDWTFVRIDGATSGNTGDYGRYASIAFVYNSDDSIKSVHVAAVYDPDSGSNKLRHSRCMSWPTCAAVGDWDKEEVPGITPQPYRTAITGRIASDGRTHVDFYASGTSDVLRNTWTYIANGIWGSWSTVYGTVGNLRLTRNGSLAALTVATGTNVYYGTSSNYGYGPWSFTQVSAQDQGGVFADHLIDAQLGIPVVAFYRATNDDLIIARFTNNVWSREVVASTGDVGRYLSLAQDLAHDYQFVYQDRTLDVVSYAWGD